MVIVLFLFTSANSTLRLLLLGMVLICFEFRILFLLDLLPAIIEESSLLCILPIIFGGMVHAFQKAFMRIDHCWNLNSAELIPFLALLTLVHSTLVSIADKMEPHTFTETFIYGQM